jgi:hypothetical protein
MPEQETDSAKTEVAPSGFDSAVLARTAEESKNGGAKPSKRPHGKGFIYWGLRDADEALRKIDHTAKRMSKDGFARALRHEKAEGRFLHKVESLRLYRLAEESGDDIVLTPLAIDMLYGGSEAARTKARTAAFLNYDDFNKTFAECPKGQDHPLQYVKEYVSGKLGIRNGLDRFVRLFLESAGFAGLLEGEPDASAKTIRLKHATSLPATGEAATTNANQKAEPDFEVVGGEQGSELLATFGLADFAGRAEVAQKVSGKVAQSFENGQLVLVVNRPVRVVIKSADILLDFPEIVKAMRAKGLVI